MNQTLNDYLKSLEADNTDVSKVAEAEPKEEVKTAEFDVEGLVKIVDERINAAFEKLAELQKEAVGAVGPTPDPSAVPANPNVELSRDSSPEAQATNATIAQLIAQLTNGERMAGPNGYVAGPAGIMAGATARGSDPMVAADPVLQAQANTPTKTATAEVAGLVYQRFFGEGEQ